MDLVVEVHSQKEAALQGLGPDRVPMPLVHLLYPAALSPAALGFLMHMVLRKFGAETAILQAP